MMTALVPRLSTIRHPATALLALAVMLAFSIGPAAQAQAVPGGAPAALQAVSPFTVTGFMQTATVDNPNDIFSGGKMTVNGLSITVPRNTLFQFPATSMTWQEMFKLAPAPYGPTQSGLALDDSPKPYATYEVTVMGNRVNNAYIAGLIFLSQQSLNIGQGYINAIDYQTGEVWIGGTLGTKTGARVQLNTPKGRYGTPRSPDQRFTSDEDNPTIHAETGYPMCVPRTDPAASDDALCPQRNRPIDPVTHAYQTEFTMPAPGALAPTDPDATQQAPFEVGDYVDYAGSLFKDDRGEYISAHTLIASVAIYTAPGVMPAYVSIEDMRLGVGGNPNPLFPQEAVEKLVVVAFTTDPSQLVDMYAVDVDPCATGTPRETNRIYAAADPSGPLRGGGQKGRARISTVVGEYLPPTREMRVVSRTLTQGAMYDDVKPTTTYANGLLAGQYHAPDYTFIFPERLVLGGPPVPLPFDEFPFLTDGSGPYFGAGSNAATTSYGKLGQLDPWPGLNKPPANCALGGVLSPASNAGTAQTVASGSTVVLDGTASTDPNSPALPLNYTWLQTAGTPTVTLNDSGLAHPFFTAPSLPAGTSSATLTFSLVVDNGFASSSVSNVTVTVLGQKAPIVNAGASQTANPSSAVKLTGSATDPSGSAGQPLKYQWTQTGGPTVALSAANTAAATFSTPAMTVGQAPLTLTFKLTVTNSLGASGTATTTVVVRPVPDTLAITSAIWKNAKSQLTVKATSSVTSGAPVLTLHIPQHADVVMVFDPSTKTYVAGASPAGQLTVNPIPSTVSVTSSFGGTASAPVIVK
jgi:hypothetical protein